MTNTELTTWDPRSWFPATPFAFGHGFSDVFTPFDKEGLLAPPMDISEDDNAYTLTAELPGLTKDDITIAFENGTVRISGEKKKETEEKKPNYHRLERRYGRFVRNFQLPEDADFESIAAESRDGVLYLKIAKRASAKPQEIEVKIS